VVGRYGFRKRSSNQSRNGSYSAGIVSYDSGRSSSPARLGGVSGVTPIVA
jgi:hypothetical protein